MPKAIFSTDQEWFELIQQCRTSGMNDKDFCKEQGISLTSLYRHIRKLKEKSYDIPEICQQKHEVVPLTVYDELTADTYDTQVKLRENAARREVRYNGSRIHISCGDFRLDIDEGADKATLRDTLSILQKLC